MMEGKKDMQTIPKILHYCWFGKGEKGKLIQFCISTWEKILPEYQIIEWNENNFDLHLAPAYVKQAYECNKYAFVSDYVRIQVLCNFGGVYLDTDVEAVKSLKDILNNETFVSGFVTEKLLTAAFIATVPNHPFLAEFLKTFHSRNFLLDGGQMDITPINDHLTALAIKYGLKTDDSLQIIQSDMKIYPVEYFTGYDMDNSHIKKTDNTYMIHHMMGTWLDFSFTETLKMSAKKMLIKLMGHDKFDRFNNGRKRR